MNGRGIFLLLTAVSVGCDSGADDPQVVCPRARPTFELTLTASGGVLPSDTELQVTYGGDITEGFGGEFDKQDNAALCCVHGDSSRVSLNPASCGQPTADSAVELDAGLDQIRCALWTNGAADVTVVASGYPLLQRTLVAVEDPELPHCAAWSLTYVHLELQRADGGLEP